MTNLIEEEIDYRILVRAEPERVYDGIATSTGLDGWFTVGSTVDARAGGEIRFRWKEWGPDKVTVEDGGVILVAERPRRFVFQWSPEGPDYKTTVEINFSSSEDGTIIHLCERGYHNTPSGRRKMLECASGWGEALALWKMYVEHGVRY